MLLLLCGHGHCYCSFFFFLRNSTREYRSINISDKKTRPNKKKQQSIKITIKWSCQE